MKRWPVAVRQWSSGALPGCRSGVQLRLADLAEKERLAEPLREGEEVAYTTFWGLNRTVITRIIRDIGMECVHYIPCCWLGVVPGESGGGVAVCVGSPTCCCACSSALTWVRIRSRSSDNDSPPGDCWAWAASGVVREAAVLAAVDGRVERRTVAAGGPADRRAVAVERRFALDLGMVNHKRVGRKLEGSDISYPANRHKHEVDMVARMRQCPPQLTPPRYRLPLGVAPSITR